MNTRRLLELKPVFWSILIFIVAQALTFLVVSRMDPFLNENQISVPAQPPEAISFWPHTVTSPSGEVTQIPANSALVPILIYFLAVAAALGVTLFFIPLSALRVVLRAIFGFLFCWGLFIILVLWLPFPVALVTTVAAGLLWFFMPHVWLHNLLMVTAMVGVGAVFGRFITPWTAMVLLLALAVYDFLAVRFGYMVWMAKRLTQSNSLPAFVLPRSSSDWSSNLKQSGFTELVDEEPAARKFSILGGGDIGFPLLLVASVYFAHGLNSAMLVAVFTLLGLISAYWIQARFLKGKAMPALPPIAVMSLIGLLVIR